MRDTKIMAAETFNVGEKVITQQMNSLLFWIYAGM